MSDLLDFDIKSTHSPLSLPKTDELLLTALQPISHHDPAAGKGGNTLLFNRAKQLYKRQTAQQKLTQAEIDAVCARETVPGDIAAILQDMNFFEFAACAATRLFLDFYNSGDGTGLFTGMERYSRLEQRVSLAGIRTHSLREFWNRLTTDMEVGVHGKEDDIALYALLSISRSAQEAILLKLATETRSIVAVARLWHTRIKEQSSRYATIANIEQAAKSVVLSWRVEDCLISESVAEAIEVPAIQGNTLRHQIVRGPAWNHLCRILGITDAQIPGMGQLPPGVEAIFVNGGNIAPGAKAAGNTHYHAQTLRKLYPSLDLLGGCCDAFDIGESRLAVSGWIVCKENYEALPEWAKELDNAKMSAYDMLSEVTQTRHATAQGVGQMIYNAEVLPSGLQVVVRLTLKAFTPVLTQGALVAAIGEFEEHPYIGGQQRAGFGLCAVEVKTESNPLLQEEYEEYIEKNKGTLLTGMIDGTMGTGTKVLS